MMIVQYPNSKHLPGQPIILGSNKHLLATRCLPAYQPTPAPPAAETQQQDVTPPAQLATPAQDTLLEVAEAAAANP